MNQAAAPRRSASLVLALLLLAYIFNFLDRQILGILAQPIKADLHLSDTQFGAIGGLAFALLYSALGVPLAYLADKTSRSAVVAASLGVWSALHRAVRHRRRVQPIVPVPTWGRHWRGWRRRALLRAHCRLFSGQNAAPERSRSSRWGFRSASPPGH